MHIIATTTAAALLVVALTLGTSTVDPVVTSSEPARSLWCQILRPLCPKT